MKKELKRIKTNYSVDILDIINNLEDPELVDLPFSIKVEKLILIALAYKPYWEEDEVFKTINEEAV